MAMTLQASRLRLTQAIYFGKPPSGGGGGGGVAGADKQVTFNDGGIAAGNAGLTFNKATGMLIATGLTGPLTGNASSATILATPRAINGVNFDGSAPISIAVGAGALTGATLAAGVTASSLTSIGTLGGLTVTAAPTFSALTIGSVPFTGVAGLLSQDNANLYWDNANKRLGIGTQVPGVALEVSGGIKGASGATGGITLGDAGTADSYVGVWRGGASGAGAGNVLLLSGYDGVGITTGHAVFGSQGTPDLYVTDTGNVGVGTVTPWEPLVVLKNANTIASVTHQTASHFSLGIPSSVLLDFGADGSGGPYAWLQAKDHTADFSYSLALNPAGGNVGVGVGATSPPEALSVGDQRAIALMELASNGTNYIGLRAPVSVTTTKVFTLPDGDGSAGEVLSTNGSAILSWAANAAAGMSNPMTAKGDLISASAAGAPATPEVIAVGTVGQVLVVTDVGGGDLRPRWGAAGGSGVAGSNTEIQFNSSGSFGANAALTWDNTNFTLSSSHATVGAHVSGVFANTNAGTASTNTVRVNNDGGNVLSLVANSSTFTSENNYARVKNVANAPLIFGTNNLDRVTIKATGEVGIGTAAPATALGVNGTVTASAFSGPLTGSVTGNVTGNITGSSGSCTGNAATATTAATVTTAAQPTITSVGTLTGLTVTAAPTFSAMTSGSVLFAGTAGLLSQDSSNLVWDNSAKRFGIGTASPERSLDVDVSGAIRGKIQDYGGQVFNVMAYGAVGDGSIDDTGAINDALAAAQAVTPAGVVKFPGGHKFKTTGGHTITASTASGLKILGAGVETTEIKLEHATNDLFVLAAGTTSVTGLEIGQFTVSSATTRTAGWVLNHTATNTGWAVSLRRSSIHDIVMLGQFNGILVSRYEFTSIERCLYDYASSTAGTYAYKIGQTASGTTEQGAELTMRECYSVPRGGNVAYGIWIEDCDAIYMQRCGFGGATHGVVLKGNVRGCNNMFWNQVGAECAGSFQTKVDGAMANGSTTLTSASNPFVAGDAGKTITVTGAIAGGGTMYATIATYVNAGQVTLSKANASGGAITGKTIKWGVPAHSLWVTGSQPSQRMTMTSCWWSSALFGDGLHVDGGMAANWNISASYFYNNGLWGIYNENSSMHVTGCTLSENIAGGLYATATEFNVYMGEFYSNMVLPIAGGSTWTTNANVNRLGFHGNFYYGIAPVYGVAAAQNTDNVMY